MDEHFGHVSSLSPCCAIVKTLTRSDRSLENISGHGLARDFVENILWAIRKTRGRERGGVQCC